MCDKNTYLLHGIDIRLYIYFEVQIYILLQYMYIGILRICFADKARAVLGRYQYARRNETPAGNGTASSSITKKKTKSMERVAVNEAPKWRAHQDLPAKDVGE